MKEKETLLFVLNVLVKIVAFWIRMSFFPLLVMFCVEVFSYCTFTETFSIGLQTCFDHDWVVSRVFWWNNPRFVVVVSLWTKFSNTCSLMFLLWKHEVLLMISLRAIFVCSLKVPQLFSHRSFYYRLIKLPRQYNFTSYVFASFASYRFFSCQ